MPTLPPRQVIPRRLGPFRVEGWIGAGGMGDVYLGRGSDGDAVAIKVLRSEFASDPDFRRRFKREVEIASRVSGLCTARLIDADVDAEPAWLATEFVEGPTLADYVARHGPLAGERLRALAAGLLEALRAIHASGVVHRDLTPNNILLAPDGPKVVDFGIAHHVDASTLTRTGALMGTPTWMAPEQVEGKRPSEAADIFAWGSVVAFAGTCRPPFGEGRTEAVLYRVVHDPPDLAGLDPAVHRVVEKALAKDPSGRPTAERLLEALFERELAAGGATTVVAETLDQTWTLEPTDPRRVVRVQRRSRALLALGVVVAVATVGGVSAWALSGRDSGRAGGVADVGTPTPTTANSLDADGRRAASEGASESPSADDPLSYYTRDGTVPLLGGDSECAGVFGICLGTPMERVTQLFGLEDARYGGSDDLPVTRQWEVGPIRVTIEEDAVGAVSSIAATISEDQTVALRLPEGLVLGQSTLGDVRRQLSNVIRCCANEESFSAEGEIFYSLDYPMGDEGWQRVSFTVVVARGDDPGGFNRDLDARRITSFSVDYWPQ